MTVFATHNADPAGDEVRVETLRGREWLVAPVVLVREGVLNGGFLSYDEIQKSVPGWNGRPVTAPPAENTEAANLAPSEPSGHPIDGKTENDEPRFVSANQPPFVEEMHVGMILDAEARTDLPTPGEEMSERGLVGEAWIDLEAAKNVGEFAVEAVERVVSGDELDVSTGYFHLPLDRQGRYNGESYEVEQVDLLPDHLALLPNERGACSWADGCGAPYPAANASTLVESFGIPTAARGANAAQRGTDAAFAVGAVTSANLLDEARTPTFEGRENEVPESWPPNLETFVEAFGFDGVNTVGDLDESEREQVAETSLLGDVAAETLRELRFFPVVNPETGNLVEGALDAVIGGRGAQADIDDGQLESARRVAYELLNDEFDRDLEVPEDLAENGGANADACSCSHKNESNGAGLLDRLRSLLSREGFIALVAEGDVVRWPSQGDRPSYGRVTDTIDEGEQYDTEIDGDVTVSGPAALIDVYAPDGDEWTATGDTVAHKEDTLTVLDGFPDPTGVNVADDPTPEAHANDGGTSGEHNKHETMSNYDIETLAERSAFDLETLRGWDDDDLAALAETVESNDDDGGDDPSSTDGDGGGDDDPAANANDDLRERLERLESQNAELREAFEAERDEKRERLAETVAAHTDHDAEELVENTEAYPDSALETLAEALGDEDTQGYPGPQGNRVNYIGQAGANGDPSGGLDEDAEGYAGTVGALASLDERAEGD